jgi:hypothetical protein
MVSRGVKPRVSNFIVDKSIIKPKPLSVVQIYIVKIVLILKKNVTNIKIKIPLRITERYFCYAKDAANNCINCCLYFA